MRCWGMRRGLVHFGAVFEMRVLVFVSFSVVLQMGLRRRRCSRMWLCLCLFLRVVTPREEFLKLGPVICSHLGFLLVRFRLACSGCRERM